MSRSRRAVAATRRLIARAPFESAVLVLAVVYVALHLSPSSYALALDQLGEQETPLVGTPRAIRSDEWAVMTPLFQAAVNNDFREINDTSFYRENMRSFIGLPLLNWGLVFKPLVWPFLAVPPALAYSFFWGASAALMLIGWSLLLRVLGFSRLVAALAAMLIYFSPIVQAWSGAGPQLALFPWLLIAVVRLRSPTRLALALAALVPAWCLSMFYVPGLPPLFFLALALLLAFRPETLAGRRMIGAAVGVAAGVGITALYFAPVLRAYAESAYPGGRWTSGGGLPGWQVASQFLPATTREHYMNLIASNISEAATLATWLPLLTLCVVDVGQIRQRYRSDATLRRDLRRLGLLGLMWALLTSWQLFGLRPLSYLLGLGLSPEARTLFASGVLLVVAAAYAIDRLPIRVTPPRLAAFSGGVLAAWLLASLDLQPTSALAWRDELLVLIFVAGAAPFALITRRSAATASRLAVLLVALLPGIVGWGLFNPLQSTRVMFRKPETEVTMRLDALAARRTDGAIAVFGIPNAVLNGVGYRSVTHVIATPDPELFRTYFPEMEDSRFDEIFNRYAHVSLTKQADPYVVTPTGVRVPVRVIAPHAATRSSGDIE